MDPLTIMSLVTSGIGLGKGIFGGIQAAKANKKLNKTLANRPKFEIPKEYQDVLSTYQRLAASNKFPGQDILESKLQQSTARATQSAERGAISSNAYQGAVGDIYQKELEAYQNLGVQAQQYQSQMQDKLAGAQQTMGGLKSEQWNINEYGKWQSEAQRLAEKAGVGKQDLWAGFGDITSSLTNLFGTKALIEAMKFGQGQGYGKTALKPFGTPMSGSAYSPQSNLDITLSDMVRKLKV